jgi:flagellar hook-associated protein 2
MSSTVPPLFSGTSTFAADLQTSLTRAVGIASLPLTSLNNQLTTLQNRSTALQSVDTDFVGLKAAIQSLDSATATNTATVSAPTVLQANADSTALAGTYSLHVVDPGSQTSTISGSGSPPVQNAFSSSITSATHLTLTVNGTTFSIDPSANTLGSLAEAINGAGANVSATIVNVGSPSAPDYRLSVQSTALGNVSIQLNDGSQDLLSTLSTGTLAQYQVNGQPSTPISSDSRTVTISPGVTVNLLQAGDATVTVARTQSSVADALTSLVGAYNAAVDDLAKNRGQAGGALTGDSLVSTLSQQLRNLAGYTGGSGSVKNITDLGLTFDATGHLSFDQSTFDSVVAAHSTDVAAFLGSASNGGFLKSATDILTGLEDPIDGTIVAALSATQDQITAQNQRIADEQARIDQLQANLTAQMSAADSLIASLQQKVSYFTSLFGAMNAKQNG